MYAEDKLLLDIRLAVHLFRGEWSRKDWKAAYWYGDDGYTGFAEPGGGDI